MGERGWEGQGQGQGGVEDVEELGQGEVWGGDCQAQYV